MMSSQVLVYASIITALWWIEFWGSVSSLSGKWRHASVNILFFVSAVPIQLATTFFAIRIAGWTALRHWGLLYSASSNPSWLIKYALMFCMLDLLDYAYHRTVHRVPLLWRFHLVHHADPFLDVSSTVREHPGDTTFRNCFLLACIFVSGASFQVVFFWQATGAIFNLLSHTTFRLPARPARAVGRLFITPNLHHVHHHPMLPLTDRNFGSIFSVWDRFFGTLTQLSREEYVFGLETHRNISVTGSYRRMLAEPFLNVAAHSAAN